MFLRLVSAVDDQVVAGGGIGATELGDDHGVIAGLCGFEGLLRGACDGFPRVAVDPSTSA